MFPILFKIAIGAILHQFSLQSFITGDIFLKVGPNKSHRARYVCLRTKLTHGDVTVFNV